MSLGAKVRPGYPFRPTDLGSCTLWLDAADPTSYTLSGTSLSSWTDKSTRPNPVTVKSAPTINYTTLNTNPTFSFSGAWLQITIPAGAGTGDYMMMAVWKQTTYATVAAVSMGPYGSSPGAAAGIGFNGTLGNSYYSLYEWASGESHYNSGNNSYVIHCGTRLSGTTRCFINGNSPTTTGTTNENITDTNIYIGGHATGPSGTLNFPMNGEVAEVIIFLRTTTTTEQQQLEGYLAWKWGLQANLSAGHPYLSSPPIPQMAFPYTPHVKIEVSNNLVPYTVPGLSLWLDSQDSSTLTIPNTTTNAVTAWADKSGKANNTIAVGGVDVVYTPNAINGYPALSFTASTTDATSSWFRGSFNTTYTGTTIQAFAVAVMSSSSAANGRILALGTLGTDDYNNGASCFMFIRNTSAQSLWVGRSSQYVSAAIPSYTSAFIVQSSHVGTVGTGGTAETETISVNGNLTPSTGSVTGLTQNFSIHNYSVGAQLLQDGNSYFQGYIAEVLVYFNTLTTAQIQAIEGYLSWKWGLQGNLPGGHPNSSVNNYQMNPFPLAAASILPVKYTAKRLASV